MLFPVGAALAEESSQFIFPGGTVRRRTLISSCASPGKRCRWTISRVKAVNRRKSSREHGTFIRRGRRRGWLVFQLRYTPAVISPITNLHSIWKYLMDHSDAATTERLLADAGYRPDSRQITIQLNESGNTRIQYHARSAAAKQGILGSRTGHFHRTRWQNVHGYSQSDRAVSRDSNSGYCHEECGAHLRRF